MFLLCVITGVHCFVHTKAGIWSTLFEEPETHQEFIQHCNLHFSHLGGGIYVEFIPCTETVSFQYFRIPEPVNINVNSKLVAIGSLTSDEQETLHALLSTGTTLLIPTTSTHKQLSTTSIDTSNELSAYPEPDPGSPFHSEQAQHNTMDSDPPLEMAQQSQVNLGADEHLDTDMAQCYPETVSAQQYSDNDKAQPLDINQDDAGANKAQQPVVITAPDRDDNSISAELVRAIISDQPQLILSHGKLDASSATTWKLLPDKRLNADEISHILNNPPKVSLKRLANSTWTDTTKPKIKCETKKTSSIGVYPTPKSASKFKFKMSQHGIKCKYKRKYSYKCQVKGCIRKFNNVKDWNKHHRSRHLDVNYTSEKCNRVSDTPIQHHDHLYTHKETQFSCGHCCKSFPSTSQLSLHWHLHK